MALRLNSLKTRTALAISMVIVVTLVANAVYLILAKRRELRRDTEARAVTFALLTRQPLCAGYVTYLDAGFYKFRELVRDHMQIDPDVETIRIVDVSGEVLFDSASLDEPGLHRTGSRELRVTEPVRLDAIKRLEHTVLMGRDRRGAEGIEIVAPYLETMGRHRLSVLYGVSYRNLGAGITRLVYATTGLTLVSMLVAVLVAVALASRITRPVEELTAGAKDLAEGHFDRRLSIRSGDELQILAETFNHMTERLKQNVEQLEESNEKLAAANEDLKELDRLKSDLLANVSHELRTPLTAIKGYTDYMLERKLGSVTQKQEKGLMVVQRNLDRLSKSINALLDFSRMDVGRISLNLQPFNLGTLVDQVLQALRSELEKKGLTSAVQIQPGLQPVIADRDKISHVIENLVMNALKFTPPGGRITVAATRSPSTSRPSAEIRVSDTGIGIPADQIGKIFNRFHQVDGSSTRRYGGVGLGLAIVKSILDAHGSVIQVESEEERGAAFRFDLPVVDKGDAPFRDLPRPRSDEGLVLIAADSSESPALLRRCLEGEGFTVVVTAPSAEGAAVAALRQPEAILVDASGPAPVRLELLHRLQRDVATRDIPILAVVSVGEGLSAFTLGPLECLSAPVEASSLAIAATRLVSDTGAATVVVVQDDIRTAEAIRDSLGALGFRVQLAAGPAEAIESMTKRRPDLLVLDLPGTGARGYQVLEAASRSQAGPVPAVVTVSAVAFTATDEAGGDRSSADDLRQVVAELRRHLRGPQRREDVGRAIV